MTLDLPLFLAFLGLVVILRVAELRLKRERDRHQAELHRAWTRHQS